MLYRKQFNALPVLIVAVLFLLWFGAFGLCSGIKSYIYARSPQMQTSHSLMRLSCSVTLQQDPLVEPLGERRERLQEDIDSCKDEFKGEIASLLPSPD